MTSAESIGFAPTLLEKIFALRGIPPFDRLLPAELTLLAAVATARAYAPGEVIHPGGAPIPRVLAVVAGRAQDEAGNTCGPLLGTTSLLRYADGPRLLADPVAGARVIRFERSHFFTLVRECPTFTLGLLELGDHTTPPPAP